MSRPARRLADRVDEVATGRVGVVVHGVDAHRRATTDAKGLAAQIQIDRSADVIGQAHADGTADERFEFRLLREEVDIAAGRATAGLRRSGAFDDLHLLHVERVAGVAGEVADTVDEDVVASAKSAQGEIVAAGTTAAFPRSHADSRDVAQDVGEGVCRLLLDDFARNDADRLGRVANVRKAAVQRVDAIFLAPDDNFFAPRRIRLIRRRGRIRIRDDVGRLGAAGHRQ